MSEPINFNPSIITGNDWATDYANLTAYLHHITTVYSTPNLVPTNLLIEVSAILNNMTSLYPVSRDVSNIPRTGNYNDIADIRNMVNGFLQDRQNEQSGGRLRKNKTKKRRHRKNKRKSYKKRK